MEEIRVRDATVEDIDRMDQLQLSDFAAPIDQIEVPQGDPLSDQQMSGLTSQFMDALSRS